MSNAELPERLKLWICCHCQSPRLYGSSSECKTCGALLHDTGEFVRADLVSSAGAPSWGGIRQIVMDIADGYRKEFKPDGSSYSIMKRDVCFKILRALSERFNAAPAPSEDGGQLAAPSDVDTFMFSIARRDCDRLPEQECTEIYAPAEYCIVCQARGLIQKYARPNVD